MQEDFVNFTGENIYKAVYGFITEYFLPGCSLNSEASVAVHRGYQPGVYPGRDCIIIQIISAAARGTEVCGLEFDKRTEELREVAGGVLNSTTSFTANVRLDFYGENACTLAAAFAACAGCAEGADNFLKLGFSILYCSDIQLSEISRTPSQTGVYYTVEFALSGRQMSKKPVDTFNGFVLKSEVI